MATLRNGFYIIYTYKIYIYVYIIYSLAATAYIYICCTIPLACLHLFDTRLKIYKIGESIHVFKAKIESTNLEPDRKKTFAMHFAFINSIVALLIKDLQNFANFPTQEFASFTFLNPIPTFRRFHAQFIIRIIYYTTCTQFSAL